LVSHHETKDAEQIVGRERREPFRIMTGPAML